MWGVVGKDHVGGSGYGSCWWYRVRIVWGVEGKDRVGGRG